jgi:hypothetical protein
MKNTSQGYKEAVYATARQFIGRVTLDITDVTAEGDVSDISVDTEAPYISQKAQLNDNVRKSTRKLVTWEQDRIKLDGSYSMPDAVAANNGDTGYVSSVICAADGTFTVNPTVTVTFGTTHTSAGCTLTFDQDSGEVAQDFTVSVYDASNSLIQTITVTGNTDMICPLQGQFLNYKKIVLKIQKWSVGNRRARIAEFDFGIVKVYDGNKLVSFNLVEEMDLITSTVPATEFKFVVDNSDRAFNILNPTGFYKYLQQRQSVIGELGLVKADGTTEFIQVGSYLLNEWVSEEGSMTASFTARTKLDLMAGYNYERLTTASKSLYALAVEIFGICGITNYYIHPLLSTITTNSLANKMDCKTAIQMVALAGCCNIFVSRDNVITLQRIPSITSTADRIDFDNTYDKPKIELEKIVKQVDVTYWTNLTTSAIYSASSVGVDVGDTLSLSNNTFINTLPQAQTVANWILSQKQYRAKISSNWRGNPAQELSDAIGVENNFGTDVGAIITKTTLDYDGALSAQTEAKGIPN